MNKPFISEFLSSYHKILPELEMHIAQDNIILVRKMLRKLELEYAMFKKSLMKEYRKMLSGDI